MFGLNSKDNVLFKINLRECAENGPDNDVDTKVILSIIGHWLMNWMFFIWLVIGILMSSQIELFTLLIFSAFVFSLIYRWVHLNKKYLVIILDSVVSIMLLCYLISSHFNLN